MACSKPTHDETDEEDHLTDCGICLSEIENPKALPCLHSFCLKCLRLVKHPPGILTCPLCQEDIPLPPGGVDGFRDNFFINQLKERRAIRNMGDVKMACICCRSTDRETFARCMDCNGFLCQQCVDLHKNITPLRAHSVFTIEELKSGNVDITKVMKEECCQEHKDQVLRWFCKTCGIPICRDCTVMEHSRPEHDYVTLESATEGQMAEIKQLVANCMGISQQADTAIKEAKVIKTALKEAIVEARKQLDEAKEAFLKALEENYKSCSDKLDKTEKDRCETIDQGIQSLHNLKSRLNNAMEIANQVMKSGSKHDIASYYSTLSKTLTQLQDKQPPVMKKTLCKVTFTPSQQRKKAGVNLGSVGVRDHRAGYCKLVLEKEIGRKQEEKLNGAFDVAISPNNGIVVADYDGKNVTLLNSGGKFQQALYGCDLSTPSGVIVTPNKQYYVTDGTGSVKVYRPNGKYLKQFPAKSPEGTSSDADGSQLRGLAMGNEGHLLVGNHNKKYISKHKQDGAHVSTFNLTIQPWFMTVTTNGNLLVYPNQPSVGVYILDNTGNLLHTINAPHDAKSWYPMGACCSDDGNIFINSYNRGNQGGIYSFTEEGKYLACLTADVTGAAGLALTGDDKLVVAQYQQTPPIKVFCFEEL